MDKNRYPNLSCSFGNWRRQTTSVQACLCLRMCMCVFTLVCTPVYVEVGGQPWVSCLISSPSVLIQGVSLNLELNSLASLAGQWTPGTPVLAHARCWDCSILLHFMTRPCCLHSTVDTCLHTQSRLLFWLSLEEHTHLLLHTCLCHVFWGRSWGSFAYLCLYWQSVSSVCCTPLGTIIVLCFSILVGVWE